MTIFGYLYVYVNKGKLWVRDMEKNLQVASMIICVGLIFISWKVNWALNLIRNWHMMINRNRHLLFSTLQDKNTQINMKFNQWNHKQENKEERHKDFHKIMKIWDKPWVEEEIITKMKIPAVTSEFLFFIFFYKYDKHKYN